MLGAFTRFVCYVSDSDELPTVKYRRARIYYESNHYEEAAVLFRDIAFNHATSELGEFAGLCSLGIFNSTMYERTQRLIACAETSFRRALREVRPGRRVCDIGGAVETEVRRRGFSVVRTLTGHGIGRTIHEDPMVPNWFDPTARAWLTEGLVLTVEPIIAMGGGEAYEDRDGWTIRTLDRSLSAHHEHTLVVTKGEPLLLTAA